MTCSRPGGARELVLLDWALLGTGPLGSDLDQLALGAFLNTGEDMQRWIPAELLEAYLLGIADSGYQATREQVMLAFTAAAALRAGLFQLYLFNES